MSDLLSIGASGVRAYQSALGTVSENIANSGSVGYARRAVELREVVAPGGGTAASRILDGMGVGVGGVTRRTDQFQAEAVRSAGADVAKTEAGVAWLGRIEDALTGAEVGARVTSFFTSARTLAADPGSVAARSGVLEAATAAAAAFRSTGAALDGARADLDTAAGDMTARLDGLGASLARINEQLTRSAPGSAAAAGLADQRDRALEEMSALVDLKATFDPVGRATVRLGGSNGPVFVAGAQSGQVAYSRGETGAVSFAVYRGGEQSTLSPNGGALGGIADAATRITDARARVAAFAGGLAEAVNAVQAGGRDLDGAAGKPVFAVGADPLDMTVALTDPRGIAAAKPGGGVRDGSNLEALETARAAGGVERGLTDLTAGNALALGQRKLVAEAQGAIRDNAVAARDSTSGVDLDTEAVDLIRFQQAYQASSRVIQVAREAFDSILAIR